MISNAKKIESFKAKLNGEHSALENLIYSEAITLLNEDVNPDKVQNWVNNILSDYQNKPKPLSEKERKKIEDILTKKQEKESLLQSLNNKMSDLINEYGVYVIGFFDWKEMCESEYNLIEKVVNDKGHYITDIGDGAVEPFITKKETNKDFFKRYNEIACDLCDFTKNNILNNYKTHDISVFRNKVKELI